MTIWLRQSSAVVLNMGPFVDSADAVTAVDDLSIGQADIQLAVNGGAFAQTSASSPTTTHDASGWYPIPLTATDTASLGTLKVHVTKSGTLPVWQECMVVSANVWDSLFGSDRLHVDAREFGDSALDLTTTMATSVADEIAGALASDAYDEPGSGAPAASASLSEKLGFLYKAWRNRTEQDGSEYRLFNDAGSTVDQKAAVDDDGDTFTRGEIAGGP